MYRLKVPPHPRRDLKLHMREINRRIDWRRNSERFTSELVIELGSGAVFIIFMG